MDKILYNVYRIKVSNFKAVGLEAENVPQDIANAWENSQHINRLDQFIAGYIVGSQRDLELRKDLK